MHADVITCSPEGGRAFTPSIKHRSQKKKQKRERYQKNKQTVVIQIIISGSVFVSVQDSRERRLFLKSSHHAIVQVITNRSLLPYWMCNLD